MCDDPVKLAIAKKRVVSNERGNAARRPNNADTTLPPSNFPMGSKFRDDEINPVKPIKNKGWIGTSCDRGSVIILGAKIDIIDPVRKLDFKSATGMTGRFGMTSDGD